MKSSNSIKILYAWLAGLCFFLLEAHSSLAATQFHGARLSQARWEVVTSEFECMLIHQIPRYGRAVFWQYPGEELQFALQVMQPPIDDGHVSVHSIPPQWKHNLAVRVLGDMNIARGETPIHWDRKLALRLFYELENGMLARFTYRDWADGADEVKVVLSTVRFRDVLPNFKKCAKALPQWRTAFDVGRGGSANGKDNQFDKVIYFATDSSELTEASRLSLSSLASQLKSGSQRITLRINGHADPRGTYNYNDGLSLRRAKAVQKYLVVHGIAKQRVQLRYFGERQLVDNRNTEHAWARNRRVAITLVH